MGKVGKRKRKEERIVGGFLYIEGKFLIAGPTCD
jgi:hypothetical protein